MHNNYKGFRVVSLLVYLTLAAFASAQVTNGVITGILTDPTGAVLPNATVTVRNTATNATRAVTTDTSGIFRITGLPPATYEIAVQASGFKAARVRDIVLTVAETKRVDITLQLGEMAQTIEVSGAGADVNTEVATLSGVTTERAIQDLPLNGRDVYQLILTNAGTLNTEQSELQTTTPAVNGQRPRGNNFMLDGVSNNFDFLTGDPVITPNVDSVQEFRILTNNFSAEYGRNSGSVINVVTKSGTNQFHGSVWEFNRNRAYNTRNFFDTVKPKFNQNQFGGSLGGPIRRDHTFFFGSYEGFRSVFGQSQVITVETPELRNFATMNFPNSVAAFLFNNFPAPLPTSNFQDIGTPTAGPQLQSLANDPTVGGNPNYSPIGGGLFLNTAQLTPDGIPDVGDVNVTVSDTIRRDQFSGRIDHHFNGGKDQLYGRYFLTDFDQPKFLPSFRGPFDTALERRLQNLGLVEIHVFSTRIVNEFRFGYIRDKEFWNPANPGVPFLNTDAPFIAPFGADFTWPRVVITNTFQYQDVLTITAGRHGLKMGGEIRRVQENGNWFLTRGLYGFFDPLDLAQDEPYLLVGGIDPQRLVIASNPVGLRNTEAALFFQDDWKVSSRLTLNLGLRYEVFGRIHDTLNHLGNVIVPAGGSIFDPSSIAVATADTVGTVARSDKNNFAPRIGFAWDPFGDGKTSVRGGFGVSYNKVFNNAIGVARLNPPLFSFSVILPIFNPGQAGIPLVYGPTSGGAVTSMGPNTNLGTDANSGVFGNILGYNPAHGFGRQNLRAVDPNLRDPYAENWFFGIQRVLPWEWVVETNYAGSVGRGLEMRVDLNAFTGDLLDGTLDRFNPNFNKVNTLTNFGRSSYHSFQLKLSRKFTGGLLFDGAYTLSKTIDNSSDIWGPLGEGENLDTAQDTRNLQLQKGLSTLDATHRLVVYTLYELPFFKNRTGPVAALLSGWQVNSLIQLQSGLPFTVFCQASFPTCDWNADGDTNDRPNTPAFGNSLSDVSRSDYINGVFTASDFPAPAPGTNGDLGRNTFRGPGMATVDFSTLKDFVLTEDTRLQFRVEAFNLFNRVNLRQVRGDLASAQFGKSVSAFPSRQLQFALKLYF